MATPSSSSKLSIPLTRERVIGYGGFGVVYSGSCVDPNGVRRQIAVKTALVENSSSLQRERRIFKAFRGCPEILTCYTGGESVERGRRVYNLLLEYAAAGTLDGLIGGSFLPEKEVKAYTWMILKGLDCIHSRGFVHCDIKPENILAFPISTGTGYQLKIADFGLAAEPGEWRLRGGTPRYMSPEAVVKGEIGQGLDVWSLGCTVVEMITGKRPWRGMVRAGAKRAEFVDLLSNTSPAIPEGMSESGKDFLRKCFERDSGKRWSARRLLSHRYVCGLTSERPRETPRVGGCGGGGSTVAPMRRFPLPHEMMIRSQE